MILQLYLAQRYFKNFLTVLAIFAVIHMVVDLTEQMRKIALNGGDLGDALTLALLNMPSALYSCTATLAPPVWQATPKPPMRKA
jgi:lipopolysaccharide export LptBFGC system permease protein LptF